METITEQPWSTNPFLRFIITVPHARKIVEPVYKNRRLAGYVTIDRTISTRAIIGFGETLKKAQKMAAKHN